MLFAGWLRTRRRSLTIYRERSACDASDDEPFAANLELTGNSLIVSFDFDGPTEIEYVKASEVPAVCEGDAFEIVNVTPGSVTEGEETDFTIQYEYRLISDEQGFVDIMVTTEEDDVYDVLDSFSVSGSSSSIIAGDTVITAVPAIFENGTPFAIVLDFDMNDSAFSSSSFAISVEAQ